MKLDGRDIGDWGLKVISYEGLLNLPARKEPTHYDWGDALEPLVEKDDIHFQPNIFSVGMFYEQHAFKSPLKKYNISAMGHGVPIPAAPLGLRHGDGGLIYDIRWHDMYNIFTIEGGEFKLGGRFYPWVGKEQSKAMAHYLKSLPQGKTVIIATWNNPTPGRLLEGLPEALYDCGASREIFASPHFKSGAAYILIGRKGIGEGQGLESYRGQIDRDPNAMLSVDFSMRGHWVILGQEDTKAYDTLEETLDDLSNSGRFYQEITTPYKTTRAKIKQIKEVQVLQKDPQDPFPITAARFTIVFQEEKHSTYTYPEGLVKVERAGMTIEGYHVEENFSLILQEFQGGHEIPPLQPSPTAPYQGARRSAVRAQGELSLKFLGLFSSKTQMVEKVEQFKALLASPGMKRLHYKDCEYEGYEYATYLSSGIAVKTIREHIAQLHFSLNIIEKNDQQ